MKIEEGKSYRDDNGESHGPMKRYRDSVYPEYIWTDGVHTFTDEGGHPHIRLVGFFGPVRSKTVQEIVPGVYGNIEIGSRDNEWLPIPVSLKRSTFTAAELADVIKTLTEVRDAMVGK